MAKVIQCPCGFVLRRPVDDALVELAQAHAKDAHGIELTREQALAMAKPERTGRRASNGEVLHCNSVFLGCGHVVRADSEEELMRQAVEHARIVHGVTEIDDALAAKVFAAITEE